VHLRVQLKFTSDGVLKSGQNLFHVRTWAVILVRTDNLIRPDVHNRFAPFRGSARPNAIKTPSGRAPHRGYKLPRSSLSPLIPHKLFSLAPCEYVFCLVFGVISFSVCILTLILGIFFLSYFFRFILQLLDFFGMFLGYLPCWNFLDLIVIFFVFIFTKVPTPEWFFS